MIGGLCESPLTFQAIIVWRDELNEGRILLRDVIDLDATFGAAPGEDGAPPPAEATAEAEEPAMPDLESEDDYDSDENAMSLAAMEAQLKPKVLATFDEIAAAYKKLRKMQDARLDAALTSIEVTKASDTRYKKLKSELVTLVKSLRLNNNRIEALVEQLYAI